MMLRILLALIIACAVGLGGCKKKEPTIAEQAEQLKQDAEKTAADVQKAVDPNQK